MKVVYDIGHEYDCGNVSLSDNLLSYCSHKVITPDSHDDCSDFPEVKIGSVT